MAFSSNIKNRCLIMTNKMLVIISKIRKSIKFTIDGVVILKFQFL